MYACVARVADIESVTKVNLCHTVSELPQRCVPLGPAPGDASPLGADMATPSTAETKDLIVLAERMGIPVDEVMRQLAQRIADGEREPQAASSASRIR